MSRTVLLSEVNEVAGRYPETIEQIRATLAGAQLPISGERALQALTERLQENAFFREDLHEALNAALETTPEITQLGALAVLVNAAMGPVQAVALADSEAADLPLRALFKFVLASRRRSREAGAEPGETRPEQRKEAPSASGISESNTIASEPILRRSVASVTKPNADQAVNQNADRSGVASSKEAPARALLTATAPGDSGMLGRALAFAADQEPAARKTYVPDEPLPPVQPIYDAMEPVARRASRPEHRVERVPLWTAPVPSSAVDVAEDEDEEELEQRPRRWGMGTAVMCGVLMGFAVGAFMHFDHKVPASPVATAAPVAAQDGSGSKGKVKSVEELSAEIAALDSLANAPMPTSDASASQPDSVTVPVGNSRKAARSPSQQHAHRDYAPLPPAQEQQPAAITRHAVAAGGQSVPPPSAGVRSSNTFVAAAPMMAASASTPAPLVANNASGSVLHTASTMHLPHVVTGSAGIMAANLVSSPAPAYPAAASAAGVQGEVVVEAVVGRGGEVVGTRVVSGPMLLRTAALEAVQRWHYRPYEVDGKPVEVATTAHVEFRLDQ